MFGKEKHSQKKGLLALPIITQMLLLNDAAGE